MKPFLIPLKKILFKTFQLLSYLFENLYYKFFYSQPDLYINTIQRRYLLYGKNNIKDIDKKYQKLFPDKIRAKIEQADKICLHIFDFLGSGPKKLSQEGIGYQPINWHVDFKSGFQWKPNIFFRKIKFKNIQGTDIKIPWELSRFQYLNILGQAYSITKNKKYVEEFVNQITDWIQNNPVGFGVNWRCTMDVAIRAVNWLVAIEYFTKEGLLNTNFLKNFYLSLYEHGKFIFNHLEHSPSFANNHYIANLAGLFFISVYCPFLKESKKWQRFALKGLFEEIEKQVYSDGCSFEGSTAYHRLVLEMLFYSELLGKRAGIEFPESYRERLKRMFEFTLYSIKPNGMIPQIGDNDNGRFLIFCQRPVLDHKYLLCLCSIYYLDSRFKLQNFDFDEEAFWVFGETGKEAYDNLSSRNEKISSKSFPDAGWYILRYNDNYCFISCGAKSKNGNTGHVHNDKLSFELAVNNQDIIVDPGTYSYTSYPEERNKFRSTEYHNVIKFNSIEQNEIPKKIFCLQERVKIEKILFKETDNHIFFQGEIQYEGIMHKRSIYFDKKSFNWQIMDNFSSSKTLNVKFYFHLSPDLIYENNHILIKENRKKIASIEVKGHELKKEKYEFSAKYGEKMVSENLLINTVSTEQPANIVTYIRIQK